MALIDVNVPVQERDKQLLDFLRSIEREFLVVATKSDRLSGNQLHNALRHLQQDISQSRILPYSAKTGAGREEVWKEIRAAANKPAAPTSGL